MEISAVGILVGIALLGLGYIVQAPLLAALFASLAFGSTAPIILTSLGGATPLLYTMFLILLTVTVVARRDFSHQLGLVFRLIPASWLVLACVLYACLTAIVLPRLFMGDTTAFISQLSGVREVLLGPVPGNFTQSAYLVLSGCAFFVVSIEILRHGDLRTIGRCFFLWATLHAGLGLVDLFGKLFGTGDLLEPLRTVNYALLVDEKAGGFWRIVGGFAEASAFASIGLACTAFCFTYWRLSRWTPALLLSLTMIVLLLFSTSTTAYIGGAILMLLLLSSIGLSALRARLTTSDVTVLALLVAMAAGFLVMVLINDRLFDPLLDLFKHLVLEKGSSESGQERAYWNARSLAALDDTFGLGIGMGSSRASSWLVAVFSQLGVPGGLMMATLVVLLARGPGRSQTASKFSYPTSDRAVAEGRGADEATIVAHSARACSLASLIANSLGAGSADPGPVFFVALAVVLTVRLQSVANPQSLPRPQLVTEYH